MDETNSNARVSDQDSEGDITVGSDQDSEGTLRHNNNVNAQPHVQVSRIESPLTEQQQARFYQIFEPLAPSADRGIDLFRDCLQLVQELMVEQ